MAMTEVRFPKYEAYWPVYHAMPFAAGERKRPFLIREADAKFDAWAPVSGNSTPSWTYVSTLNINAGKFAMPPGGWFDASDHPNPETYFILEGTLHLSNPDTSDVVELRPGDAAVIPAWAFHHGFNFGTEDCVIYWLS